MQQSPRIGNGRSESMPKKCFNCRVQNNIFIALRSALDVSYRLMEFSGVPSIVGKNFHYNNFMYYCTDSSHFWHRVATVLDYCVHWSPLKFCLINHFPWQNLSAGYALRRFVTSLPQRKVWILKACTIARAIWMLLVFHLVKPPFASIVSFTRPAVWDSIRTFLKKYFFKAL